MYIVIMAELNPVCQLRNDYLHLYFNRGILKIDCFARSKQQVCY